MDGQLEQHCVQLDYLHFFGSRSDEKDRPVSELLSSTFFNSKLLPGYRPVVYFQSLAAVRCQHQR